MENTLKKSRQVALSLGAWILAEISFPSRYIQTVPKYAQIRGSLISASSQVEMFPDRRWVLMTVQKKTFLKGTSPPLPPTPPS